MKVLLLGVGLQGKAALYDLVHSADISEIIAADFEIDSLKQYVKSKNYENIQCEFLDANKKRNIDDLMSLKPDVIIDLLPVRCIDNVLESAVEHGIHFVNTNTTTKKMKDLAEEAKKKNISILPEFGLDPGIDLVLIGEAIRKIENIKQIKWYGAGIPEFETTDNPLKYKVTWTFEGVLRTYYRPARLIKNGEIVEIKENEIFNQENIHEVEIEEIGTLEAFPNGDALSFLDLFGITNSQSAKFGMIQNLGRYTLRWPGHCEFWKKVVDLHLLDSESIKFNGVEVDKIKFLSKAIEPHIQLKPNERDVIILRVEVVGMKNEKKYRVMHQVIDKRDLKTGFTAMNRTVGFTVSIGAQFIAKNIISKKGLLSPVIDIPFDLLEKELNLRGINFHSEFNEIAN
ncbi:MAG: saccharopine dehydrogenase family protein [Candidatus Thorarchaeota archaeon]